MVLALKVENRNKMPVPEFVIYALNKFRQAPHTQPYEPAKIEINPADQAKLPATFSINDIPLVASEKLEPGFLRVVTQDIQGLE